MKIVFLLEEQSMKSFLDEILPKVLPEGTIFQTVAHRGKGDLLKSIPIKLQRWNEPGDIRFVVVHDQDKRDCRELKQELQTLCDSYRTGTRVCISCQELEAWYWGDLDAVSRAFKKDITPFAQKRRYRIPDAIESPKEKLKKIIPDLQQIFGAKAIGKEIDVDKNSSQSFCHFISCVRLLCKSSSC